MCSVKPTCRRVSTMADDRDEELITRLVEDEIILRRYGNLNEGQYHAKQREIDKLWQQDENSLNFLRDSLRNSNDVTNKMVGVLKTFDDRLKHLLGSIRQIHHSTTKWKNVYKNIDSGLSNFKDVIELFDTTGTAKPKLSSGVSAVGVTEYLEVMDKLQTAISFFMNNTELKSATKTLEELQRLQTDATAKLKAHYEQILRSVSSPAEPSQLRVDVTESKSSREVRMTAAGQVLAPGSVLISNEQTIGDLNKMIKRLDLNKESSYLALYTTLRSEHVLGTLAKLQPHKMLQMFADSEASTSGYMRGTHPCMQFISALLVLLFTERNLIARLLPSKHVTAQFRAVLEPSMQQLSELADGIIKLQRRNANRQYAVCVLLDLWAHVTALSTSYATTLTAFEDEEAPVKRGKTPPGTLLSPVITKFSEDLTENTREILSEVKGQWSGGNSSALSLVSPEGLSRALAVTSWSVPSDGTVAQQTVMAVQFLSALFPYKEIVVNLLPTLQPISGKSPLAVYIIRSLEELIDTMETRAKKEKKSQALTAIYLLNNYYFIWKGVKSNAELSKEVGSQVLDGYQKRLEEQKELYKRTWSKCSEYFEDRELKIAQGTKLHSAIKHCLSGFNAEFEDNFSNQVQFFVADDDLRAALRGELKAMLVPPYKQFLSKYGNEEFAKKKDKYLKYSAESLEGMIGKFFDGALTKGKQLLSAATNN